MSKQEKPDKASKPSLAAASEAVFACAVVKEARAWHAAGKPRKR